MATGYDAVAFAKLLAEIGHLGKGDIVLVAAGVLSTIYCDRIRAQGAMALDVGSAADYWALGPAGGKSAYVARPGSRDRLQALAATHTRLTPLLGPLPA